MELDLRAAVDRVSAYVAERDAFYGVDCQEDVIDTATGDTDNPLLLSDLRLLADELEEDPWLAVHDMLTSSPEIPTL